MSRAAAGRALWVVSAVILLAGTPRFVFAQERGANALGEAVRGIGVNARVLLIGAHPDDEDTFLISWLSRGRHVETAYLSLTRGDGGQNLIGNELGEALGVIRTEELYAARRVDGARQFFARAFDFGFSKDTVDTYRHWPRDSILGDVVRVVRAFRPHVIVAVFSGTPRDGHGHHQVSGLLAREAYRVAGDTARFPRSVYGAPWMPLKLYGNARYDPTGGVTLTFDVGEYAPLLGRSYAEIAGESRSQHKSQGFGVLQRKGPLIDRLRREMSRVNDGTPATSERSIFDGIDTSWTRFRAAVPGPGRQLLDSLPLLFAAAARAFDPFAPATLLTPLTRVEAVLNRLAMLGTCPSSNGRPCGSRGSAGTPLAPLDADLEASLRIAGDRIARAKLLASGIAIDAVAAREVYATGAPIPVVVSVYNRGADTARVSRGVIARDPEHLPEVTALERRVPPGAVLTDTLSASLDAITQPSWLARGRRGALFNSTGADATLPLSVYYLMDVGARSGTPGFDDVLQVVEQVVFRSADPVRGEVRREVVAVPAISVTLDQQVQYAPANTELARDVNVHLRSAGAAPRDAIVRLALPPGMSADSGAQTVRLSRADAAQTLVFRLRGKLPVGDHRIGASVESNGETFATGYDLIDYEHIGRQRVYRPAVMRVAAVDMRVPATLRVAYVTGVGDNVAAMLAQLGIPVTIIAAAELTRADLQPYTTVVIGPRAYEAHPELAEATPRLMEFARKGGTIVAQYGQYEMTAPGIMPFPITLARPADRVTQESSPVTIDAPNDKVLRSPNRIGAPDFEGWVQERALYMPRTIDERYRTLLSMNDPGEPINRGAILVAPVGEGHYVYTTLSLFRQLPAGVPGAARLFINLLSAGLVSTSVSP